MFKNNIKINYSILLFLFISLAILLNNFFRFFQNNTGYQFDPWLSNYQGGFVRRGLPGEFFYQIYNLFNIHPGWMIFIFVSTLYFFIYLNFYKLIKNINLNRLYLLIIFSPIGFYFPILNSKATGHKEVIFLFFLSLLCLLIPKFKKKQINYLIIFITIIIGLSYEVLIFYLIYLIIPYAYFYKFKDLKDLFLNLIPFFITSTILILLNFYFKGSEQQVADICNSIKQYVNSNCQVVGKIADLKLSIEDHLVQKSKWNYGQYSLYVSYFKIYGIGFLISFLPLMIIYKKIKNNKFKFNHIKIHPLIILILPMFTLVPVFYMGADWGRYLYISYISSLFITFFFIKNNIFVFEEKFIPRIVNKIPKALFLILLMIYCFGWTVPICCEKKFKPGIINVIKKGIYYYDKNY